jgi:hypothetical protein
MDIQPSAQKSNLVPIRELVDAQPIKLDLGAGEKYRAIAAGAVRVYYFRGGKTWGGKRRSEVQKSEKESTNGAGGSPAA